MRIAGLVFAALLASTSFAAAQCPTTFSACPPLAVGQINLGGAIVNQQGVPFVPPVAMPTASGQVLTTNGDGTTRWGNAGGGGSGPAATITATGTNQGTAALIAAQATVVTIVPSGAGVVMNITFLASEIIYNRGANPLTVYPFSSAQIEGNGANNPVLIAVGGNATFRCISTTQCYTGP